MSAAERQQVVRTAWDWLGTPYHHHARVKGAGVDCANLLCAAFAGIVGAVQLGNYPVDWHLHRNDERFLAELERCGARRVDEARPGDIAVFRFGRCFSHGAVIVDDRPAYVHAYIGLGVVLTRADEEPLLGRPVQFWSVFR